MDNNIIGKYIEKKRKSKGLTQKELAKRLGLSNTAISKWECGCNLPDVSMLEPLSKELGVDVSKLVALQSGHVNYQSFEELEEPEESQLTSNINESNLTKHKFHMSKKTLISLIIIIILFITTNIITAKVSHSIKTEPLPPDEVKVYEIISDDPNFSISGYMIYNSNEHLIMLNEFNYQSTLKGTNDNPNIKNLTIYIYINDEIVFKHQNGDEKILLNEALQNITKNNINDKASFININTLEDYFNTAYIKIEYTNNNNQNEEIDVKIILKQAFI